MHARAYTHTCAHTHAPTNMHKTDAQIYMHTRDTHMCSCAHTYTHAQTRHMHSYIHTCHKHTYICAYTFTYQTHIPMHYTHTYTCMHACTHTHTHLYTHTYSQTYTHTFIPPALGLVALTYIPGVQGKNHRWGPSPALGLLVGEGDQGSLAGHRCPRQGQQTPESGSQAGLRKV